MNRHEQLKKNAEDAINALYSDTTVGNLVTRDDLQSLRDKIDEKIAAIDSDVERDLAG